eukprot:11226636-Lingulodinium_polyedra.AAC.1
MLGQQRQPSQRVARTQVSVAPPGIQRTGHPEGRARVASPLCASFGVCGRDARASSTLKTNRQGRDDRPPR